MNANVRSFISDSVGVRFVTTFPPEEDPPSVDGLSSKTFSSRLCTKMPPAIERIVRLGSFGLGMPSVRRTRTFCFSERTWSASSSAFGAITTSRNIFTSSRAHSASSGRFRATMPPKAETESQASAFMYASRGLTPSATPHGFVCFTITTAHSSNSVTHSNAASASRILL